VRLDPTYAPAHTGLGSASFVAYVVTRATLSPDLTARDAGIEHARRAIRLDDGLAEAHATLSFLLVSAARFDEARESASRAVTLEPESWRHQYRLGHAQWGSRRLEAFGRAVALYPQFSYAHFEATMVHVARGHLELALDAARQGAADQQGPAHAGRRFPAIGFHWLLGALASAQGRHADAMADFDRELAHTDPNRLYGPEYGALALICRGHAQLALGDADAALHSFSESLTHVAGHPRACLGQALAFERLGRRADRDAALTAAGAARTRFEDSGRRHEARFVAACDAAIVGHPDEAARELDALLTFVPASF
jgi:tetratricopeptide (TPR) repeat protein